MNTVFVGQLALKATFCPAGLCPRPQEVRDPGLLHTLFFTQGRLTEPEWLTNRTSSRPDGKSHNHRESVSCSARLVSTPPPGSGGHQTGPKSLAWPQAMEEPSSARLQAVCAGLVKAPDQGGRAGLCRPLSPPQPPDRRQQLPRRHLCSPREGPRAGIGPDSCFFGENGRGKNVTC